MCDVSLQEVVGQTSKMGQRLSEESDPDKEIDVAELQEWYKKFVVECPSGTLFMHEFKSFFGVTENKEAADYIENMFRAFDKNGVSTTVSAVISPALLTPQSSGSLLINPADCAPSGSDHEQNIFWSSSGKINQTTSSEHVNLDSVCKKII